LERFLGRNGLQGEQKFQPPSLPLTPIRRAETWPAPSVANLSVSPTANRIRARTAAAGRRFSAVSGALGLKAAETILDHSGAAKPRVHGKAADGHFAPRASPARSSILIKSWASLKSPGEQLLFAEQPGLLELLHIGQIAKIFWYNVFHEDPPLLLAFLL
jgi:hypothetical protein